MAHRAVARSIGSASDDVAAPIACAWCGTAAPDGVAPITWMSSIEGSGSAAVTLLYCDRCSREHLRGIESKLDAVWW